MPAEHPAQTVQEIHDMQNAKKWLEGQIISYLYGGTDEHGLSGCVRKVTSTYKVSPKDVRSLIESVEENLLVYYGGRYRLAYGAMGRRFGGVSFIETRQRTAVMRPLRDIGRALPNSR